MPKLLLDWDELEIIETEAKYQWDCQQEDGEREEPRDDIETIRQSVIEDWVFWESEAETTKDTFTELMDGHEFWKITGSDMGWRKLSGEKYVMAETGSEMLEAILPNADCTWWLYKGKRRGFTMKVSHHDAPMGEHYIITPIAESTYDKNKY